MRVPGILANSARPSHRDCSFSFFNPSTHSPPILLTSFYIMPSGFTVSRSGPRGHSFKVQSIHMGVCMHEGIDIGDIFYKDGDIEVKSYTQFKVNALLRTATPARQATFSFLTPAGYSIIQAPAPLGSLSLLGTLAQHTPTQPATLSTGFTVERSAAPGRPYIVRTIHTGVFNHAGEKLFVIRHIIGISRAL
jgi:hypothetical protein